MLAVGVPTAVAYLTTAIMAAAITKPMAVALLDQAETVRLLPAPGQGEPARVIPAYAYPESAVRAIGHAARYQQWRDSPRGRLPVLADIDRTGARSLVSEFLSAHPEGGWLAAADAVRLLASYRIPMVTTRAVNSSAAAVAAAAELGGPVVLKAEVAGLVHKTDAGAVKLDLRSPGDVAAGHRGSLPVDTAGLAGILQRVSRLADDLPEVAELDLNPVMARPHDVQVVDVRVRVALAAPRDPFPRRLR